MFVTDVQLTKNKEPTSTSAGIELMNSISTDSAFTLGDGKKKNEWILLFQETFKTLVLSNCMTANI